MRAILLLMATLLTGGPRPTAEPEEHRLVLDQRGGLRLELVRPVRAETTPPMEGALELVREGGARRRLAEDVGAAAFAPDGAVLAIHRGALLRLEGGRFRTLVASGLAPELQIDSTGSRVALVRLLPQGDSAIDVLELAGEARPRQIVSGPGYNNAPVFAPDGRTLLFVSTRTGLSSLFRVDLSGEGERQLTNRGLKSVGPGFVPPPERAAPLRFEGDRLVWSADGARWFVELATGTSGRSTGRMP
ncbi:MAG: PD40 domain-containing protein [Deltaproteobacteria bacterium]|nr:PD40 domain-containing protein [Deltaproteobacteria bacterium]